MFEVVVGAVEGLVICDGRIMAWYLPLCFRVILKELVAVLVLLADLLFSVSMPFGGLLVLYRLGHIVFFPWPRLPRRSLDRTSSGAAAMAWLAHAITRQFLASINC